MKKWKHIIFILLFFSTVVFSHVVFAQDKSYVALSPLPGISDDCVRGDDSGCFEYGSRTSDAGSYLKGMFQLGIGVAAALAVIMITIGGVQYVTSSAFDTKNEGRQRIMYAVGGLILAIASWLILQTINPALLNIDFSNIREGPPPLVDTSGGAGTAGTASTVEYFKFCYKQSGEIRTDVSSSRENCARARIPIENALSTTGLTDCFPSPSDFVDTNECPPLAVPSPSSDTSSSPSNADQSSSASNCTFVTNQCMRKSGAWWFCRQSNSLSGPYDTCQSCESVLGVTRSICPADNTNSNSSSEPSQSGGSADDNTTPPAPDQTQETSDSDTNTSQSGQGSGRYLCFASGGQITVAPFANTSQGRALCNAERSRHRSEGKATSVCFSRSSPPSASGCPAIQP